MVKNTINKDISKAIQQEKHEAFNLISDGRLLTGIRNKISLLKPQTRLKKILRPAFLLSSSLVIMVIGLLLWFTWRGEITRKNEITKTPNNEVENLLKHTLLTINRKSINGQEIEGYLATALKNSLKDSEKNIKAEKFPGEASALFYIFYNTLKTMEDDNES